MATIKLSRRIHIIEDNPDDLELCKRTLLNNSEIEYHFSNVKTGSAGLDFLEKEQPDCVLLDYSLPGRNGLDLLCELRAKCKFLPIIMMTGQGDERLAVEAIKQGADDYLVKTDINQYTLERSITAAIKNRMLEREVAQKNLALGELEKINQTILDNAPILIGVMDKDFKFKSMNAYAQKKLKYLPEEFIGIQTPYMLHKSEELEQRSGELSVELGREIKADEVLLVKMKMGEFESKEWTYVAKDGATFPVILSFVPLKDEQDELIGILGTALDITELKKTETEREKLIDELANSNEALEHFAYVCSHDLQEPLRMIRSFSDELQIHMGDTFANDEKGKKYFHIITDAAKQAQELIKDILTYSSINNTQNQELFSTENLINVIKENMRVNLEANKSNVMFDKLPELWGNKTQIYQLLQNLISNAIKYQPPNSSAHIQISAQDLGRHWQFAVKDNGIGIEKQYLNKVFDVFQRLHRDSQYSGTGIGLAICKKVVERHGGKIWVESEKGKGSTFYFTILKSVEESVEMTKQTHILYVEDNFNDIELFKAVFERCDKSKGLSLDIVETVSDAKEIFNPNKHIAAILDLNLPDGDGLQVAEHIRSIDKATPIVFCTGTLTEILEIKAKQYQVNLCMEKDYSEDSMNKIMEVVSLSA